MRTLHALFVALVPLALTGCMLPEVDNVTIAVQVDGQKASVPASPCSGTFDGSITSSSVGVGSPCTVHGSVNLASLGGDLAGVVGKVTVVTGDIHLGATDLAVAMPALQKAGTIRATLGTNATTLTLSPKLVSLDALYVEQSALTAITGGAGLTSVVTVSIGSAAKLTSFKAMANVQTATTLQFQHCAQLTDFEGFGALTGANTLVFVDTPKLLKLQGFANLVSVIGHVQFSVMNLTSMGLSGLQSAGALIIQGNHAVTTLAFPKLFGLGNLRLVDCPQLASLAGLSALAMTKQQTFQLCGTQIKCDELIAWQKVHTSGTSSQPCSGSDYCIQ